MSARTASLLVASVSALAPFAAAQAAFDWSGNHVGNAGSGYGTGATDVASFPSGGVVTSHSTWEAVWIPHLAVIERAGSIARWSEGGQKLWSVGPAGVTSASAVAVDDDGSILVATGGESFHVHRIDANGAIVWSRTLQGGRAQRVEIAPNGDVVAAGRQANTIAVGRWSANGTPLWMTAISPVAGPSTFGEATWLGVDAAGASYVLGRVQEGTVSSVRLVKHDASGQVAWAHVEPGSPLRDPTAALAPDGGVVFCAGDKVVRLAADGSPSWQSPWTSPGVWLGDVDVGADGVTWVLATAADSSVVRRYDPAGVLLTEDVYDPLGTTQPCALVPGGAGQFYATSTVRVDGAQGHVEVVALQYDASGQRNWSFTPSPTAVAGNEWAVAATLTEQDRLVLAGDTCNGCAWAGSALVLAYDLSDAPQAYCEGKVNSLGCTPAMTFTGQPSAGASSGFVVGAQDELADKLGMLLYGVTGAAATPFQGGTLCLAGAILRTPAQSSGGAGGCSGAYAIDINAFAHGLLGGNPHPVLLTPGATVWCQVWGRDPGFAPPNNTSLSNGLRYVVLP